MATYRCLQSGNFVTFTQPHDIESMKGHQGYVRIDEVETEESVKPLILKQPVPVKKMGRPRKLANV
jgi:transcriptional regulator CtsR